MVRIKSGYRWLTVVTAVAVYFPYCSQATSSVSSGETSLTDKTKNEFSSLPAMITQKEYNARINTGISSYDKKMNVTDETSDASVSALPVGNASRKDVQKKSLSLEGNGHQGYVKNFQSQTETVAQVLSKGSEGMQKPPLVVHSSRVSSLDTDLLEAKENSYIPMENPGYVHELKKRDNLLTSAPQSLQLDSAYNRVRWNGEVEGANSKRLDDTTPVDISTNLKNSTLRAFLRQMVSRALSYSPEVRSSEAEVMAAGFQVEQTKGQRWPQVQLGVTTPLANKGSEVSTHNNSNASDTSGNISVTTPVFDWGKISNQIGSAEEDVNAAVNSQNYTKEQLAYSTISELMNLSRYQENRVVALAYVQRMKQLTDMLEQITAADKGRASEYVQAKAKLLSARASLDDIEHQVSTSRIKLVRLLGIEPDLPADLSWQDSVISPRVALSNLTKNPNLLKLQAQVKSAEFSSESIQAASLPQLNWIISKNTAKDSIGQETGWYTGLSVQWNAFSGGSQKAAQQAARAKANGAQQQYEVAYRDLEYQINNMVQTRNSSFMRADDFERLSYETDRVRKMFYDQWYNLGKRTLLDVLTAENDHFNNQLSAINNRYDGYVSNINIIASAAMLLNWVGA